MDSSSTSRAATSILRLPLPSRSRSSTFWPGGTAGRLSIRTGDRSVGPTQGPTAGGTDKAKGARPPAAGGPDMAKAVRVHQPGGPEVLVYEDIAVAAPGPGEVRIRQHASGLNFID